MLDYGHHGDDDDDDDDNDDDDKNMGAYLGPVANHPLRHAIYFPTSLGGGWPVKFSTERLAHDFGAITGQHLYACQSAILLTASTLL